MKFPALLACALIASAGAPPPEAPRPGTARAPASAALQSTADITVTVVNMRNSQGVVRACLTDTQKSFPKCRGVPGAHVSIVDAHEGKLVLSFKAVRPGRYAIAVLHDENGNGKADRALGMMPREGFGFSRDAPVRMGPPKFDDAVFDVKGRGHAMTIKMRYML